MDVFSDKQNYNHVNWNYMAKNRCQHNILQIFREIILFLSFICFKTSMLFGLVSVFRLLPSLTYFFYRFIKYFKLIKYPVNDNVILTKISQQVYSVKCSSFFSYTTISIPPPPPPPPPKPRKTSQYLIKTDFPEGNHVLQNQ